MAIIVQEQKRKINWFGIAIFIFLLLVILGGGYFLFFAPVPGIEILAPTQLETAAKLSEIEFDPSQLINDPNFKGLRQYGSLPSIGNLGRDNPLLGF